MRWVILVLGLGLAATAQARPHGGAACIDSYGTVIEGINTPAACKKLGARWGKPGTKSLPKEAKPPRESKRGHGHHHYAHR